jgi:TolB protein
LSIIGDGTEAAHRVGRAPHLSPDGGYATYLSYPPGTIGHPANLDVQIHLVRLHDWSAHVLVIDVLGGQGTLNVNSWAPDSDRFAYVSYPLSSSV